MTSRGVGFPLDEKLCRNIRLSPFNIPFLIPCLQPLAGGPHGSFLLKLGCWLSVDMDFFGYLCTIPALAEIFGGIPGFTHYHFNHDPQRRGHGGTHPRKIDKILFPMFRQGCLVFTGRGSRCERGRKLWGFSQKEEELAFYDSFLYGFSRGKHCTVGRGSLEQSRRVGMTPCRPCNSLATHSQSA